MGLEEKRIMQDYIDDKIPATIKEFNEKTDGAMANVKVEVDWDSLLTDKAAINELWSCWLQPFYGVEAVCKDKLGKEGVKSTLKKIVFKNVKDNSQVGASFVDGVLTAQMDLARGTNGTPGWTAFQKTLEEGL